MLCFTAVVDSSFAALSLGQSSQNTSAPSSKSAPADSRGTYHAGKDGVSMPACRTDPTPPYSNEARAAKYEGSVLAQGEVTIDGRIENIVILRGPGMGLEESVIKTLKKWKCTPATLDGKPVRAIVPFQISFRLK
jgi:periplasmic protein TonB